MSREYIIWGKPPLGGDETLLVSEAAGIASMEQAQRVIAQLTDIGCTDCRVQVFTLGNAVDVISAFKSAIA
jgi:hypothetical protein